MTLTRSEREPVDAERVTRSVELDAAPAEVWDALTEGALLGEWLADEVELEAEPGGEIVCRYADGEERRGEVELVEEAERDGDIRADIDPKLTARLLFGTVNSLVEWYRPGQGSSAKSLADAVCAITFDGLRVRK